MQNEPEYNKKQFTAFKNLCGIKMEEGCLEDD